MTEDELIALARLAKPVEVVPEKKGKNKRPHTLYSNFAEFIAYSGLKAGKNLVDSNALYNAYLMWAKDPMPKEQFVKSCRDFLKEPQRGFFKVNMAVVTIIERIKERKQYE